MSRVEHIEAQVRDLAPDELQAFREWFAEFDHHVWDLQIEADSKKGFDYLLNGHLRITRRVSPRSCDALRAPHFSGSATNRYLVKFS